MRTLIANGTIVTADGSYQADVLVDGETIAQIGADLAAAGVTADETIDATGKYVIPGGIDAHTHMELPFGGTFAKDTFETGTRAAAFGGTTQHRGLRGPVEGPVAPRGPRGLAREGRGQRRRRLRLPHDHVGRQRRHAGRDGPAGRGGRPRLQAVHRLSGRLPLAGRPHLPGDAADEEERRHDPDARRERPGDRHPGGRAGRERHDRPAGTRPRPGLAPRGRGDEPDDPPRGHRRRSRVLRPPLGQGGAARRAGRARARRHGLGGDLPAVPVPDAGRPGPRVRGRQVRVLAAAADAGPRRRAVDRAQARRPPGRSGRTTARSTSTARRRWAAATSGRSPTGSRASRSGWT